jgi:hypothetical protein
MKKKPNKQKTWSTIFIRIVFLLSQSMYFCFMYVPYLFFNYALYIFVHIFTGVEMLCLFVYQLFIDLSIKKKIRGYWKIKRKKEIKKKTNKQKTWSTLFIRISIKSRTNMVMVICLSIVIDDRHVVFIHLPLYTCLHVSDWKGALDSKH